MTKKQQYKALAWAVQQAKEWRGYWIGNERGLANYDHNMKCVRKALKQLKPKS